MTIRLTRGKDGPDTLTCVRDDGSCTWQPSSEFFARHDLIHYAVETTLGYKSAFFGLVAVGRDLDSFGTKNGVKDVYTDEEGWAESLVGLLQWPSVGGGPPLDDEALEDMLQTACANGKTPTPAVTPQQLARIRADVSALHRHWERVPPGESLELRF
ncbi:MAG: hypothetical protein JO250_09450 [Armatimonadetes bacterium]|nr:hypothetical protein [Armatimonadota bacterium]